VQNSINSLDEIESQWTRLKDQREVLGTGWHDKASEFFDQQYWSEICSMMNSTLPVIRENLEELNHLAEGATHLDDE